MNSFQAIRKVKIAAAKSWFDQGQNDRKEDLPGTAAIHDSASSSSTGTSAIKLMSTHIVKGRFSRHK